MNYFLDIVDILINAVFGMMFIYLILGCKSKLKKLDDKFTSKISQQNNFIGVLSSKMKDFEIAGKVTKQK